ncbi:hypothetical protein AB9K34_07390 [Sedimentitalea sp. XS_ASV28]
MIFIFQPPEEGGAGAKAMIDNGLFTCRPGIQCGAAGCDTHLYGTHPA